MPTKIFVNLPVNDLGKSKEFYTSLGFSINPQFTDETAACVVLSESIYVMILTHEKFSSFTPRPIADAKNTSQVLLAIDLESKARIDEMVEKAVEAGGSVYAEAKDYGWMYYHSFADPDGHQWELMYMNEAEMPKS